MKQLAIRENDIEKITEPSEIMTRSFLSIFGRLVMPELDGKEIYLTDAKAKENCGCVYLVEVTAAKPKRRNIHIRRTTSPRSNNSEWLYDPPVSIPLKMDNRWVRFGLRRIATALASDLQYQMTTNEIAGRKHLRKARMALRQAIDIVPKMDILTDMEQAYLNMNLGFWLSKTGDVDLVEV